jgi:putative tryptophan/tyrosine transport system substrate-binding protein
VRAKRNDNRMRRREFIALLGGTAAGWPPSAYSQQPAMPVIGFISSSSPSPGTEFARVLTAFRGGLNEVGYVEGQNIAIEYRWAGGQYDRLPALAADLVRRQVSLIAASGGLPSAQAAKAATETIPILFVIGTDPVQAGLVAKLSRPGGNATGVSVFTTDLGQKRLELLHKLVPEATTIALLVNPNSYGSGKEQVEDAARDLDLKLLYLEASVESDFDAAFAIATRQRAGALWVTADPFFTIRRAKIIALAARHRLPAIYPWRQYAEAGGLMSYGPEVTWAYHQIGLYAGRILNGAMPSDLPVLLPTRFHLLINLKTAKALGLTIPRPILVGADEVIE